MELNELTIITVLLFKHTLADYFFQYSWMIKDKGLYGAPGGVSHAGVHWLLTFICLGFLGVPILYSFVLSVFDGVVHYHIDYVKNNVWKSKKLTPADQLFWVAHGVDQFAHILTYVVIILLLRF